MITARILTIATMAVSSLTAADLTGHWSFDGDVSGNPIKLECDLKQQGAKLEGVCHSANGEHKLAGEVNEPKVRFSYAVDYQGATYTLYYTGILEQDSTMAGEILVAQTNGTFSARKTQ